MKHFPKKYSYYLDRQVASQQKSQQGINITTSIVSYIPYTDISYKAAHTIVLHDILSKIQSKKDSPTAHMQLGYGVPSVSERFDIAALLGIYDTDSSHSAQDISAGITIRDTLHKLHKTGLLKYKKKVVYRSFKQQKIIPAHDIQTVKQVTDVYYVRYFIDTKKDSIVIPIANIQTLFADVAIAVNPIDKRFKKLVGKKVIVPIINRIIPIVGDEAIAMGDPIGFKRVTPAHDFLSYEIACRHGLPTDIYAYDDQALFSQHATIYAGKSISEFKDNIIQYLQDIHNLDQIQSTTVDMLYYPSSDEYIYPYLLGERCIDMTTQLQSLQEFIASDRCIVTDDYKTYFTHYIQNNNLQDICITNHDGQYLIPHMLQEQGSSTIVTEANIAADIDNLEVRLLAMLIFSLVYDSKLPAKFTIDDVCDVLLSKQGTSTLAQEYLAAYTKLFPTDSSMQACIQQAQAKYSTIQESNDTSRAESLLDLLDTIPWLLQDNHRYHYQLPADPTYATRTIDTQVQLLRQAIQMQSQKHSSHTISFVKERHDIALQQELTTMIHTFLLHDHLQSYTVRVAQEPSITDKRLLCKTSEKQIRESGSDAMRLGLLYQDQDMQQGYEQGAYLCNKFRNAARYVYVTSQPAQQSFAQLQKQLEQCLASLNDFDIWILYRLQELARKYSLYTSGSVTLFARQIIQTIIDDVCVKYLEVAKQYATEQTPLVMHYVIVFACQLLYPFMPSVSSKIRDMFSLSESLKTININDVLTVSTRNYKVHLLMNIIGACLQLKEEHKIKKHQAVHVYIQAPMDILQFIESYENIVQHIVRSQDIRYSHHEQNDTTGYWMTTVIDMHIGIKQAQEVRSGPSLADLHQQLQQKQEYLQHMRSLAAFQHSIDKEQKIATLKADIEALELQMHKLRAKK